MQKVLFLMLIMALAAILWPNDRETYTEIRPVESEYVEYGIASFYANLFVGRRTSSGEIYHHNLPTAAHQTLPLGTRVRVTCMESKKSVEVTINDRGPFVDNRIIDLSRSAFDAINDKRKGLLLVRVEVIEDENSE